MLIWMRNSAFAGVFKYLLMGLLLMAVVGLILMDRNGAFTGGMSSGTVVKGGGINIGLNEFDRTLRRVLSSRGIGAPEAYQLGLVDNVLSSEIQARLFSKEASHMGLEVSDDMVTRQITRLAETLATQGGSKKNALQQILRQQGISEAEFVSSIRAEMANTLLRAAIQPPATLASPLMARALYRYDHEQRSADIVVLKNTDMKDVTKPSAEQLQKYYEANKMDFLIPESRTITVATLKKDMAAKKVNITDEQLRAEYDKNIAAFTKPSKRVVAQGVFQSEEEAKKAYDDVVAGKPAKGLSDQELEQNGLLPEIATPVFAAQKGDVIGPVKTDLGWHVLKVKDILPESRVAFDQVKGKLGDELKQSLLADAFYQTGNDIEDRSAGGDKLEDIVLEYGMTTEVFGPFRRNGNNADGKDMLKPFEADKDKIIQAAFDVDPGETAPLVETADGQFHLVRVDSITPDSYRDFKLVSAALEKRWMDEQQKLANAARVKSAVESLNAGKTLDEVAKVLGASVQKIQTVSRTSKPQAPITPVVAAQIFTTDIGKSFSSEVDGGFLIGMPTSMVLPKSDAKMAEEDIKQLEEITARALPQDVLSQYIDGLSANKKIKINQPVLQQTYGTPQTAQ